MSFVSFVKKSLALSTLAVLCGCGGTRQLVPAAPPGITQAASPAQLSTEFRVHYLGGSTRNALILGGGFCSLWKPNGIMVAPKTVTTVIESYLTPCKDSIIVSVVPVDFYVTCQLNIRQDKRGHIRYHVLQKTRLLVWCRYYRRTDGSVDLYYWVGEHHHS